MSVDLFSNVGDCFSAIKYKVSIECLKDVKSWMKKKQTFVLALLNVQPVYQIA